MKKGFTLIEIIISVGLIALIGTVSMVSFNFIKKNNIEKKLENMSDAILTAVNVYIETNSEVKDELYNNKNGLKIPLSTLENSGLVDFSNIDVSNEYVVTMLGSTNPDDDTCASTYTAKSWNFKNGETIYICEKSDGTTNLVSVAGVADNLSKTSRETYYFKGEHPQNYVKIDLTCSYDAGSSKAENRAIEKYRIYAIDRDDSILLAIQINYNSNLNFRNLNCKINEKTATVNYFGTGSDTFYYTSTDSDDYKSWLGEINSRGDLHGNYNFIIRLSSTCKITNGTGMEDNPFQITC